MSKARTLADDPRVRREIERGLREKQRAKLLELRKAIKAARASKRARVAGARAGCKLARQLIAADCATRREAAREQCAAAVGRARARGESEVAAALAALADERGIQRRGRALLAQSRKRSSAAARTRRVESDDEVKGNLPEELHAVYDRVKRGLPKRERATRTEVFLEWVAEHGDEVAAIQADEDFRQLERWQREERRLARELKKPRGKRSVAQLRALEAELDDIPF